MTVNDIYKCSNVGEDTRFVIYTKEHTTIYDGPWYYIDDELKKAEVNLFCVTRFGKKNKLPYAEEVLVERAE